MLISNVTPSRTPNHAHIELSERANGGEAEIMLNNRTIKHLHACTDKPGAEFDVSVEDRMGHKLITRHFKSETTRAGETVNLPLSDNRYIIKVDNVRGAKTIDVFAE